LKEHYDTKSKPAGGTSGGRYHGFKKKVKQKNPEHSANEYFKR